MTSTRVPVDAFHRVLTITGATLQAVAGIFVAVSGLLAPPWGVAVLVIVWLATTTWAMSSWRRRRFATLIAFAAMALFWVVFLNFGDLVLGWTA